MRIEPLRQPSDPIALAAVICGVAPLPLSLFAIVPCIGMLAGLLMPVSVVAAVVLGIVGVTRAKEQPEPNYVLPVTGIVLGLMWLLLAGVGVALAMNDFKALKALKSFH